MEIMEVFLRERFDSSLSFKGSLFEDLLRTSQYPCLSAPADVGSLCANMCVSEHLGQNLPFFEYAFSTHRLPRCPCREHRRGECNSDREHF